LIGDEARIVDVFCAWLEMRGWTIEREVAFVDVLASRDVRRIFAEAKGRTTSPGLDVDTMFGQLLRRVPGDAVGRDTFAVVVPDVAVRFVERVPLEVRRTLNIHVYAVSENNTVLYVGDGPDPAEL
jgi:hypothetical protein